jgi:hypothetical protein
MVNSIVRPDLLYRGEPATAVLMPLPFGVSW